MSDIDDIYKAPKANLKKESPESADAGPALAPRGKRLFASMIDGSISMIVTIPLMLYLGIWENAVKGLQAPLTTMLILGVVAIIAFLLMHGYLLKKYGQTIGKSLTNIYIVDLNNNVPEFPKLIALRYLPMWIITFIPVINSILPLVDSLFIFRKDKRCIHDLLAGTKVIVKTS